MKTKISQYLNEIVSLAVMLLMAVALIAGQAGAAPPGGLADDAEAAQDVSVMRIVSPIETVHALEIDVLRFKIEMNLDDAAVHGLSNGWSAALGGQLRLRLRLRQEGQDQAH